MALCIESSRYDHLHRSVLESYTYRSSNLITITITGHGGRQRRRQDL